MASIHSTQKQKIWFQIDRGKPCVIGLKKILGFYSIGNLCEKCILNFICFPCGHPISLSCHFFLPSRKFLRLMWWNSKWNLEKKRSLFGVGERFSDEKTPLLLGKILAWKMNLESFLACFGFIIYYSRLDIQWLPAIDECW